KGHHRDNSAVHGHRDRHLIERDLIEKDLHIEHGVDRDTGFADIARNAFVIGIVAAVRGQVERNGKPALTCCKIPAIECIRFFRGRKSCVLTYRPGSWRIHCCVRATEKRRDAGGKCCMYKLVGQIGSTRWRQFDTFRGNPRLSFRTGRHGGRKRIKRDFREVWFHECPGPFANAVHARFAMLWTSDSRKYAPENGSDVLSRWASWARMVGIFRATVAATS